MSKHTTGPWAAGLDIPEVANNNPDKRLVWSGSLLVADCRIPWIGPDEAEANARLIAAAPELLEACKAARAFGSQGDTHEGFSVSEMLRYAIARAEGRSA